MTKKLFLTLLGCFYCFSCGNRSNPSFEETCSPGVTKPCICPEGGQGQQTCDVNSLSWGTCEGCKGKKTQKNNDAGVSKKDVERSAFSLKPDANPCGNNVIDPGEECDNTQLGGNSCIKLGMSGGLLTCNPDCTLDLSGCHRCGDGIKTGDEQCDKEQLGGKNWISLGFTNGELTCKKRLHF